MNELTVLWVVPPIPLGSGGHRTIFMHANYLVGMGFKVFVWVQGCVNTESEKEKLREFVSQNFFEVKFELIRENQSGNQFDIAIATFWTTAFDVALLKAKKKIYFVQDFEPGFYPVGDAYLQSLQSYDMIEAKICIGRWLPNKLRESGVGGEIGFFDFGHNPKIYFDRKQEREEAICVLFQPDKHRRCPVLVQQVIDLLERKASGLKIYCYGSDYRIQRDGVVNLGILSEYQLAELYNKCKYGFVVSATNPSRIPFEMLASGLCVIDLAADNNFYDYSGGAITLAKPNPVSIANSIFDLVTDAERQKELRLAAATLMQGRSTENECAMFYNGVIEYWRTGKIRQAISSRHFVEDGQLSNSSSYIEAVSVCYKNRPKLKKRRALNPVSAFIGKFKAGK